jgi:hypothetical protein
MRKLVEEIAGEGLESLQSRTFRLVKERRYWPQPYSIEEQEPPGSLLAGQWFRARESRPSVTRKGAWRALPRTRLPIKTHI